MRDGGLLQQRISRIGRASRSSRAEPAVSARPSYGCSPAGQRRGVHVPLRPEVADRPGGGGEGERAPSPGAAARPGRRARHRAGRGRRRRTTASTRWSTRPDRTCRWCISERSRRASTAPNSTRTRWRSSISSIPRCRCCAESRGPSSPSPPWPPAVPRPRRALLGAQGGGRGGRPRRWPPRRAATASGSTAVGPGMLTDGMAARLIDSGELDEEALAITRRNIPLRRFGTATDIAEAVCFLASDRAGFITGRSSGWTAATACSASRPACRIDPSPPARRARRPVHPSDEPARPNPRAYRTRPAVRPGPRHEVADEARAALLGDTGRPTGRARPDVVRPGLPSDPP